MPINPCRNPQCEYFNKSLPSNAKICPWCGEPLGHAFPAPSPAPHSASHSASHSTPIAPHPTPVEPIPESVSVQPHRTVQPSPPVPSYPPSASRPALRLIHPAGREFHLHGETGYIGRSSPTSSIVPEIDLKGIPNDGVVSRGAHARLYWDANQNSYVIVDNSSRNGTFLNGTPLKPDTPYRLNHGSSLQLGQDGLVTFTVVVT